MSQFTFKIWLRLCLGMLTALLVSFITVPAAARFARAAGAVDMPGARRINHRPVPRMGGIAVFWGFFVSVLLFCPLSFQTLGLLAGAVITAGMGAMDDIYSLRPVTKLSLQILAALLALYGGSSLSVISVPWLNTAHGFVSVAEWLRVPLTVLWIVACTNALNLIDGLDGLAAGVTAIGAAAMLFSSIFVSRSEITLLLGALIGACAGFAPYNLNPAKIFMGDTGSQLLGYLMGVISLMGMFKTQAAATFAVPLLCMAFPLFDTAFAFLRRVLTGHSPFEADRGHLHHKLLDLGFSQRQAVEILCGVSAIFAVMGVALTGQLGSVRMLCLGLELIIITLLIKTVRAPFRPSKQKQRSQHD